MTGAAARELSHESVAAVVWAVKVVLAHKVGFSVHAQDVTICQGRRKTLAYVMMRRRGSQAGESGLLTVKV